jgi:hypothetical protein
MAGSSRLGFRPGRTYHNAVLATMYIAVFVVIAGLVIANVFLPLFSSPSSSQPAEAGADSVATSTPANSADRRQPTPSQTQSSSQGSLRTPGSDDLTQTGSRATPTNTEFEGALEQYIKKNTNITVVSIDTHGGVVYIEWIPHDMTTRAVTEDIGYIAGAYDGLIRKDWDVKRLQGTVLNTSRQLQGTFQVKTQWVRQRQRGEISNREVINRTMETINTTSSTRDTTIPN